MKNKLFKRITASAAALTMFGTALLSEFPVLTTGALESIEYKIYYFNEVTHEVTSVDTSDSNYTLVTSDLMKDYSDGLTSKYYGVTSNTTIDDYVYIKKGETVRLLIKEGVTLTCNKGIGCGYAKNSKPATLYIYGGGKLIANGKKYAAGIGGDNDEANGIINIHGTTIEATGGKHAAGIGGGEGGQDPDEKGEKSKITIYAGDITATGGIDGAGIGGGDEQPGARTYIYGGDITASSEKHGAGIGGGDEEGTFGIHIYDGKITATGGEGGAGIGAGEEGGNLREKDNGGGINIYGGEITAKGGGISEKDNVHAGAGIGGGWDEDMSGTIFISGVTTKLTAQGGIGAAGIGAGRGEWPFPNGDMKGEITINCGDKSDLKIIGGSGGAGIGAGFQGNMQGKAYINGGKIKITSGYEAAGIGGGREGTYDEGGEGGTVYIGGGDITIDLLSNDPQLADSHAIGRGALDEKTGTLYISKEKNITGKCMRVDYRLFREKEGWSGTAKAGSRTDKCHAENDVHITVCDHKDYKGNSGLSYSINKENNTHTVKCKYCGYKKEIEHNGNPCTDCGYQSNDALYDITLVTKGGSSQAQIRYAETQVIRAGTQFTIPECEHKMTDQRFIGWKMNDQETLKQTDETFTVNSNVTLTAQYADLYHINKNTSIPNGSIDASKYDVDEGEMIIVKSHPESGYTLSTVTVKEKNENGEVLYNWKMEDGKNSLLFEMPAKNIYITADFKVDKKSYCYITGASLSLEGDIGINIYFNLPDSVKSDEDAYFTVQGPNDAEPVKRLVSSLKNTQDGYLLSSSVCSAQMGEKVSFILYNGHGENIPIWNTDLSHSYDDSYDESNDNRFKYSVKKYLKAVADNNMRDLMELAETMENYGAWARQYLINTNKIPKSTAEIAVPNPVDSINESKLESWRIEKSSNDLPITEMSLLLESKTTLRLYYEGELGEVTAINEQYKSVPVVPGVKNGKKYVEIQNIAAPELGDVYTITLGNHGTIKVSALSYAEAVLRTYGRNENKSDLCEMVKSLYEYYEKASHYFESLEG